MNSQTEVSERPAILDTLVKVAPTFQKLFPLDCSISVTDREVFLIDYPAQDLVVNQAPGTQIPENSGVKKAITSGQIQMTVLPEEVYGVPFKSVSVPVKDDIGQIVGCMALGMSLKNQERLEKATRSLVVTSQEIVASTEELAASAQELADGMELVDLLRKEMEEHVQRTEKLLSFIRNIAQNSNILGINAAIEAARAGEKSQGFNIIAIEIRKMANSSSDTVDEIKIITEELKHKMSQISKEMHKAFEFAQNQAATSEEITAAIQELSEFIVDLESVSKVI